MENRHLTDSYLLLVTTFRAKIPFKATKEVQEEIVKTSTEIDRSRENFYHMMLLPKAKAIHFNNCNIMDIHHDMKIEVHFVGLLKKPITKCLPITLGTIQLVNPLISPNSYKMATPHYYQQLKIPDLVFVPSSISLVNDQIDECSKSEHNLNVYQRIPSVIKISESRTPSPTPSNGSRPSNLWDIRGNGLNSTSPREFK